MKIWHKNKIFLEQNSIIPIVGISSIASVQIADGKNLPVFFLDTNMRPDFDMAIEAHRNTPMGEILTTWGRTSQSDYTKMYLKISMQRPTECEFYIFFDVLKHAPSIDLLIRNEACWMQSSKGGTTVYNSEGYPKLIVEVKSSHIQEEWDRIYLLAQTKRFKNQGVNKKAAKKMAIKSIETYRKLGYRL